MSLQTRVKKLEESCTNKDIEGARACARLAVELGACKPEDEDFFAEDCARKGITIKQVLKEVEGATRGLPKRVKTEREGDL